VAHDSCLKFCLARRFSFTGESASDRLPVRSHEKAVAEQKPRIIWMTDRID
jgi:hypothetical protein